LSSLVYLFYNSVANTGVANSIFWGVIKVSLILATASVILTATRRISAAERSLILRLTIAAAILLPLISFIVPTIPLGIPKSQFSVWRLLNPALVAEYQSLGSIDADIFRGIDLGLWLIIGWSVGVIAVLSRLALGFLLTTSLVRRSRPLEDEEIAGLVEELTGTSGSGRRADMRISTTAETPFVFGILRPIIILPAAMKKWSRGDLRMVILHELAHIKRNDLIWAYAGSLAAAVHWFNPLIWIIRRKMIMESDKTCDDYVLCSGAREDIYAERLVSLARDIRRHHLAIHCGADMARKSQLEERIMSILSKRIRSTGVRRSLTAIMAVLAVLMIIPLAGLQLRADETAVLSGAAAKASDTSQEKLPSPDEFIPVTVPAEMIESINPVYPDSARKAGWQGIAWVQALVDREGIVRKVIIKKSSGYKILDDAAMEAAAKSKFKPALQGDKPVPIWLMYSLNFTLEEKADSTSEK
jgi:TonB family protein